MTELLILWITENEDLSTLESTSAHEKTFPFKVTFCVLFFVLVKKEHPCIKLYQMFLKYQEKHISLQTCHQKELDIFKVINKDWLIHERLGLKSKLAKNINSFSIRNQSVLSNISLSKIFLKIESGEY